MFAEGSDLFAQRGDGRIGVGTVVLVARVAAVHASLLVRPPWNGDFTIMKFFNMSRGGVAVAGAGPGRALSA
ncbi:hypothetical protein SVIO_012900 [Streptomyces violaceusniger]|uniref:Uncharacterized protein n=1 Tax=Streptomyces violaceusniger TaxID=68280 RepID=A0A4D4KVY0_STRVO|nr:hypothetical protein SVIO_012900 [Streptomyces violaceusniger]